MSAGAGHADQGLLQEPVQARFLRARSRKDHPVRPRPPYHRSMPTVPKLSDASDDVLMSAYARGDAAAFEQLYARHERALYRFVRRLLGNALAAQTDEVFQDTWLRVVHARSRWE